MAEPDTDSDAEHHDNDTMGMSLYRQMQRVFALQNLERDARRRRGLVMQAMLQDIQRENDMHDSDDEVFFYLLISVGPYSLEGSSNKQLMRVWDSLM